MDSIFSSSFLRNLCRSINLGMSKPVRTKKIVTVGVLILTVTIILLVYGLLDPTDRSLGRFFPKCPVKLLTGLDCPSCGIQRVLHAMLSGNFLEAFRLNYFIPFSLIYLPGMLLTALFCVRESPWRRFFWGVKGAMLYIGVYIGWFVVRNIWNL